MDVSKSKATTNTQSTINQPACEHSSSSSSSNDSPDVLSHSDRSDGCQASSKSPKSTLTKSTASPRIVEAAPVMLNVSQIENHKSSTTTAIATSNEQESRVEVSGKVATSPIFL